MTTVVEFFRDGGKDPYGRTLQDMLGMNDFEWESSHDVVQWAFPLHEPSNFNDECPLVRAEELPILQSDPKCQENMRDVLLRFTKFLGFEWRQEGDVWSFYPADNYQQKVKVWRTKYNHNYLRITRVIRSLRLFGMDVLAQQFYDAVYASAVSPGHASQQNAMFWRLALLGEPMASLRVGNAS